MLIRVAIAVVCAIIAFVLFAPVCHLIGFPANGDVQVVFRVLVAGIAALYILKGSYP